MPKISDLSPTSFPLLDFWFPASHNGETNKLSLHQVRELMKFKASEISYNEGNVSSTLAGLETNKANQSEVTSNYTELSQRLTTLTTSTELALQGKFDKPTGAASDYVKGDGTTAPFNKAALGLSKVENLSPLEMPISTATKTSLDGKAGLSDYNTWSNSQFYHIAGTAPIGIHLRSTANNAPIGGFNISPVIRLQIPKGGNNDPQGAFGQIQYEENVGTSNQLVFFIDGFTRVKYMQFNDAGDLVIPGRLYAGSKSFTIDHPLDPANKNLSHTTIETARNEVQYNGTAQLNNGEVIITIDDDYLLMSGTIAALTKNGMVTSLVNQSGFSPLRFEIIEQGKFKIICQDETSKDRVVWSYAAIRNDPFTLYVDSQTDRETGNFIAEQNKRD